MASVLSYLRELNIVTMMLRILLAVLCGGLIGLERERKNRPAGFRTYMLTALGATLTVLLSLQLDQMLHGPWARGRREHRRDAGRVALRRRGRKGHRLSRRRARSSSPPASRSRA